MMEYQKTEGIILHLIPFGDSHQIVILFTLHAGLMKVMCYGSRSSKSKWHGLCRALTQVEIIYREKNSEIYECRDLTLIHSFDNLKQEYQQLEAACDLLYCLNRSQLVGKTAPKLYALLIYYLSKISQIHEPWILSLSFRLKLLRHDGLLDYPFICQVCEESLLLNAFYAQNEAFCAKHACENSLFFAEEDLHLIYALTACPHYSGLTKLHLSAEIKSKVFALFEDCLSGG